VAPDDRIRAGAVRLQQGASDVSTADLSRSGERDNNAFCRQGYGALLAKLAVSLPILSATPVKTIEWWSRARIEVDTPKASSGRAR